MKRRIWDSKSKARIVLEGLQGRSVASLCSEYQITQSMYYRWRDTFLANAAQAFEAGTTNRREERLSAENQKLKQAVGELTLELKKNDW
ncbi:transposase [Desulfovibrio desulfuricans]|uniref:transposase n=1 Tax=Desulfovibrio desulfuricans TaxID=876 RepID=UPI001785F456|nr:transposase [Desulfovibrio desulfuricans]MBD8896753.1 transposase [Desulfovibrio desulfuricans]